MMLILIGIILVLAIVQSGFSADVMTFLMDDCLADNLEFSIIAIIILSYFFIKTVSNYNN